MGGAYLYGWDSVNSSWVKLVCTNLGKLIIDPSEIFEDPPTDGEAGKAATSNWSHDHNANADAHHTKFTVTEHDTAARHPLANLDTLVCSEAEADSKITTHKGDADAHHTKFTVTEHDTATRHPLANLDTLVCSEAEADSKIATHTADEAAHRTVHINAENYTNGYLVATDIPATSHTMFRLEILGNSYQYLQIVDIKLQGYLFAAGDDIIATCALAAHWSTDISVFCYGGYLYFWFAQKSYYETFSVFCAATINTTSKNRVTGITNAVKPVSGITRDHVVTPLVCYGS